MIIKSIDAWAVWLPFRFSFAHSLATRASSDNLVVALTLADGTRGWGEGVPRDYVTGEDIATALANVRESYAPRLVGSDLPSFAKARLVLQDLFASLGLAHKRQGASFCALELAVLDACARAEARSLADCLGPVQQDTIRYGGVVPFGSLKAVTGMLCFYRLLGFKTVKIKVGGRLEEDIARVKLSRTIMGPAATLRVDANCAWSAEAAVRAAEAFSPWRVASIEQPVAAGDIEGLERVCRSVSQEVVVDESLCTVADAKMLAEAGLCGGFNIRLSKVGGLACAEKMVAIAQKHAITCHLGAQVGESGILSAAARIFACTNPPFANYEGSANRLLLKRDLTVEDLTCGAGGVAGLSFMGKTGAARGLGVHVDYDRVRSWAVPAGAPAGNTCTEKLCT